MIPWSTLADRIGRVRAISISVTVATVVGLLVPFAPTFELLLAGRFLEGLVIGGVPAIAIAYLTEEIDPAHAARAAGTFVAGTTIGGLLGRVVSSPVAEIAGWRIGVFTVAVLCGLAALGFVKLAPQPQGFVPSKRSGANPEGSLADRLTANLRSPRQLALFAQGFLLMGGFVALYNFLGFRLTAAPFHLPPFAVSLVFVAYLAGTWASPRAGAEAPRFGRKRVLLVSIAVMAAGVAITHERQRVRRPGRSADRHCRLLRRPLHRVGLDRPVGTEGQGAGLVAVQPVLLRRVERLRLVRRRGLRRARLGRGRGNHCGAGRHRGGRGSDASSRQLDPVHRVSADVRRALREDDDPFCRLGCGRRSGAGDGPFLPLSAARRAGRRPMRYSTYSPARSHRPWPRWRSTGPPSGPP